MVTSNQPVINVNMLEHVCVVVKDIDKSVKSFADTFGINFGDIRTIDDKVLIERTYRGKPGNFSFKIAFADVGDMKLEVIQPLEGDSIYRDFLREHGEGLQHIGWYKPDTKEEFDETIRKLEQAGFPCIMSGYASHGVAFAYFDTTKLLHTTLELEFTEKHAQ